MEEGVLFGGRDRPTLHRDEEEGQRLSLEWRRPQEPEQKIPLQHQNIDHTSASEQDELKAVGQLTQD